MSTPHRDRAWLEAVYRAHRPSIYAYAARRIHLDEVDDLVAEVFTTAWRSRDTVPDDPLPWLYRVAANHILHARRGRARQLRLKERVELDGAHVSEPPEVAERLTAQARVHAMLARLPESDADILRLAASEQLSAADIGVVLGCSASTARVRLHRARRRAEKILARLESEAAPAPAAGRSPAHPQSSPHRTQSVGASLTVASQENHA